MRALVYDIKPLGWVTCRWLRHFWAGCLISPINGVSVRDLPGAPLPGDDWVRVRTLLGGICGTDLAILWQKPSPNSILQAFSSMPMVLGHENVGVVEQVGPAVDGAWVGRRVCVEPTLGCQARGIEPMCRPCQVGQFGVCENFGAAGAGKYKLPAGTSIGYNAATGGSLGESFLAHHSQLIPLPPEIPDELAVLTDPLACSLHSVLRADLGSARQVLVYGPGMLGLGVVACLRAIGFGGRIDVIGRHDYLDKLARQFGADEVLRLSRCGRQRFEAIASRTGASIQRVRFGNLMMTGGYDVTFDCVGSRQSVEECIKWTAARGQVVMVGTGDGGGADMTPIWFRELTVLGAYGRQIEQFQGRRIGTYQLVHKLMTEGKLKVRELLTHTFRLDDYRQALTAAMSKSAHKAVKVALDFRR